MSAEISYRERCVREFEWRVRRKAELEEEARQRQPQLEHEERERLRQLEQARIDRLLDDAESLRRATNIRAYLDTVRDTGANEITSISAEDTGLLPAILSTRSAQCCIIFVRCPISDKAPVRL